MRAQGYPFPWQQVMQSLLGGGQPGQPQMPNPQHAPYPQAGVRFPGYPMGPGGMSELDQAGDALKAWWQKLTS
jgi:hypothetical protein